MRALPFAAGEHPCFVLHSVGFVTEQFAEAILHARPLLKNGHARLIRGAGNQRDDRVGQVDISLTWPNPPAE